MIRNFSKNNKSRDYPLLSKILNTWSHSEVMVMDYTSQKASSFKSPGRLGKDLC